MKRILSYLLVVLCLVSCKRSASPIPRGKLAKIYAEMFILDEQINSSRDIRRVADTSRVYEAVLDKYGYTFEEYRASQERYLRDPERYSRILKKTVHILEAENKLLKAEKKRLEDLKAAEQGVKLYAPDLIYYLAGLSSPTVFRADSLRLYVDSIVSSWVFDPQRGFDTAYYGPRMFLPADSVKFRLDSLARADSLARLDSIARADSIARKQKLKKGKIKKTQLTNSNI